MALSADRALTGRDKVSRKMKFDDAAGDRTAINTGRSTSLGVAAMLLAALLMAGTFARSEAAGDAPRAAVEALHASLLDVMREADSLGFDGRLERLGPVVGSAFDFTYISRLALGAQWAKLDEAGRARMQDAMAGLTLDTYAARFDGYDGERFETVSSEKSKRDRWLVRTRLVVPGDDDVALDYLLHEVDGKWRIVNVIANGVSDLSIKRAEYASIVKSEGFNRLIDAITRQREEMQDKARKAGGL